MSVDYTTIVQASFGFWSKLFAQSIDKEAQFFICIDDSYKIRFLSENKGCIDNVINLSKRYPNEIFYAKTKAVSGKDFPEHYVIYNGEIENDPTEMRYTFFYSYQDEDKNKININFLKEFQNNAANHFKNIAIHNKSIEDSMLRGEITLKDFESLYKTYIEYVSMYNNLILEASESSLPCDHIYVKIKKYHKT